MAVHNALVIVFQVWVGRDVLREKRRGDRRGGGRKEDPPGVQTSTALHALLTAAAVQ